MKRHAVIGCLLATVALLTSACGSGVVNTGGSLAGPPKRGGTLRLIGQSDISNLDTVSAYYTVSSLLERMFTRQLFTFPTTNDPKLADTVVPDVATVIPTAANGGLTDGGRTMTVHLRRGVEWDTAPRRGVTAGDFVREFKMLCNPQAPVGAPSYFTSTIVGMADYCAGFAKVRPTTAAIANYVDNHALPGVVADNDLTLTFHLLAPTPDFLSILTMGFCSARPVEYMRYLPDSAAFRAHTLSDGPYQIVRYVPNSSFELRRNPAWRSSSDPIRRAYVATILVNEGLTAQNVQQQLEAGTADMEWDLSPPAQQIPLLIKQRDQRLLIGPVGAGYVDLGTYLALNQYAGPLRNKLVREAVAYAVDKNTVARILGGPQVTKTTSQMILPGNVGYQPGFDPYPDHDGNGDPARARRLLAQAGYPHGLTLKFLYSTTDPMPRVAQAIQASLELAGFHVKLLPVTQADFYGKYLENPTTSKQDVWDIAPPGWIPDWFGDNGRSTVTPMLTNPGMASQDFGGYHSAVVDRDVGLATSATSASAAARYWVAADEQAMEDVATVPINVQKWPVYHSANVGGCVFLAAVLNCDPTNVWVGDT